MAETVKSKHVAAALASVEADLSAILQLLRQLTSEGYEVLPEGLGVIEGMVFTTSLRLSDLSTGIVAYINSASQLVDAGRGLVSTIKQSDAEIREAIGLARESLSRLRAQPRDRDLWGMVEDCLKIIEVRSGFGAPPAPTTTSNVLDFAPRPIQPAPEGGAA